MKHHISCGLVRCIDFRLTSAIYTWLTKSDLMNKVDILSEAGVSKCLVDDPNGIDSKSLLHQIGLAKKLHSIQNLYLLNHTDCGAYGGHDAFANAQAEFLKHSEDMHKAKFFLEKKYPGLSVKLLLAKMKSDTDIEIVSCDP